MISGFRSIAGRYLGTAFRGTQRLLPPLKSRTIGDEIHSANANAVGLVEESLAVALRLKPLRFRPFEVGRFLRAASELGFPFGIKPLFGIASPA